MNFGYESEYSGGPSYAKTGWIMYIVDKNGTPVSDAVYISCGGEPQGIRFLTTRLGGLNPRQVAGPVPWVSVIGADGAPFDNDQDFKGIGGATRIFTTGLIGFTFVCVTIRGINLY